jgi:glycosyltransferase involved in cell wall biosynthesis
MTENRPLLTLAIPTYNRAVFLKQVLDSVRDQVPSDSRVELIISDNGSPDETQAIVELELQRGTQLIYIRNTENIGPDANFLQCYERARGKYVWIFSDDDLLRPGAITSILTLLSKDEYDLVFVSSTGFTEDEPVLEPITNAPRAAVFTDAAQFVRRVHIFTTLISGNIVNKDRVEANGHEPFAKLIGSNLIQLGWTFTALRRHRRTLYIEEKMFRYRLGTTGGYGMFRVFGPTLSSAADDWLRIPRLNRLIVNASLQRMLPTYLLAANRNDYGSHLEEDPQAVLSSVFSNNLRYWLFDYPLLVLPSWLAWFWLQLLRVFNRVDRAFGYPSLSW